MHLVRAFGRFWYDFLVGDQPVLFLGPIVALVLVGLVVGAGWTAVAGLLLFALVSTSGALGLARDLAVIRRRDDR
jgi:hypothetical protein